MTKIEIKNTTKILRHNKVLDNINLTLTGSTVVGFRGINGSGKTMLMRLISGLIAPSKGEVLIDNKVLGRDISFPESLGILLENPAFIDDYSAFENLKLLASIKGISTDEMIYNTLKRVGLSDTGKKKFKKFSLGMKQRLGIAAAIMEKPRILILDEPTNSLDDNGVELVKKIVKEEKERGALVIISCHDKEILESLSDEIYFITEGKITNHSILTGDKL